MRVCRHYHPLKARVTAQTRREKARCNTAARRLQHCSQGHPCSKTVCVTVCTVGTDRRGLRVRQGHRLGRPVELLQCSTCVCRDYQTLPRHPLHSPRRPERLSCSPQLQLTAPSSSTAWIMGLRLLLRPPALHAAPRLRQRLAPPALRLRRRRRRRRRRRLLRLHRTSSRPVTSWRRWWRGG